MKGACPPLARGYAGWRKAKAPARARLTTHPKRAHGLAQGFSPLARGANTEAIYHAEGRLSTTNNVDFSYEYTLNDHLGNARVSFRAVTNGAAIQYLQENHYYPFGMEMEGPWQVQVGVENQYQYNGKELNEDFGLNLMDYGARWYDGSLGRFCGVDPLGKYNSSESLYNFVGNNSVNYFDPSGGFRIPDEFRNDYPNLVKYLENQVQGHIESSAAISGALWYYSGGNLNPQQIADDFKVDHGPMIRSDNNFSSGRYEHHDRSLVFNKDKLARIEKILSMGSDQAKQIALIEFMKTFVNEYTHYGDALDGYDLIDSPVIPYVRNDYSVNGIEPSWPNRLEEGNHAAAFLYPSDDAYINFLLFTQGKYSREDKSGEGKEKQDESKVPPVPKA